MSNTTTTPSRRRMHAVALAAALTGCSSTRIATQQHEVRSTGRVAYYHATFGAGPTVITREDRSVLDERRYEPFGAAIDSASGPVDYARDPHNLLNKETDVATGWSDHGARWLAPETGRWLTPDPPLKAPDPKYMTEPWGLHPYQYVKQNPIVFWDPDGRDERPTLTLTGGSWSFTGPDGVLYTPVHPTQHAEPPSTGRRVLDALEMGLSPGITIAAGKFAVIEKAAWVQRLAAEDAKIIVSTQILPEAEAVAKPLDKASSVLSFGLSMSHVARYQLAESEEEKAEHAGGAVLGAASMYLPAGVVIAFVSIFDPNINQHVGRAMQATCDALAPAIDVDQAFRDARHEARMETARRYAPRLPAATDWHDAEWAKLNTPPASAAR
jgi:RHS repeat-associated protein